MTIKCSMNDKSFLMQKNNTKIANEINKNDILKDNY